MTIREAIHNSGIDTLDAYLLLEECLTRRRSGAEEFTKTKLLAINDAQITKDENKLFKSLIERRKNGECTAYITGKKEFWGLEFFINKNVLVPRPETEILVEKALEIVHGLRRMRTFSTTRIRILDLCTGSGAIAIALKHEMPELEVFATDISQEALEVAKKNAARLLPNNNNITFLKGDLYSALSHSSFLIPNFSLVISNPPYIPSNEIKNLQIEVQNEPHIALDGGETGMEIIERIIKDAPEYLLKGGHLLLELNSHPGYTVKTKKLLENRGFKNIIIYKDLAGLDRVIGGRI